MRGFSTSHSRGRRLRLAVLPVVLLGVMGLTTPVRAIDPERAMSQYLRDQWGSEHGFPGGPVHAITQTEDGYLWIAGDKGLVRFDGFITSTPADRVVLAASNTMSWGFNDGNVAVEAEDEGDVDQNSFSHTRVYNVTPGDYTYYALAQIYGKAGGNGTIWAYGNLLVEFFPTENA